MVVGAGYAIGYWLGPYLERVHRTVGRAERVLVTGVVVTALGMIGWRVVHALRGRRAS